MSNPGVIFLASVATKTGGNFRVEDNIGEAIHLHYENLRIDLTTTEFLRCCDIIEDSLQELIEIPGFCVKYFDPVFLSSISGYLCGLREVRFENILLTDLKIVRKSIFGLPIVSNLSKSRISQAISGNTKENDFYIQKNFFGQSNQQRLCSVKNKMVNSGYPYNGEYIVVFNNQNLIRDGQHRAAILLSESDIKEVTVMRLMFENNNYNMDNHPWLKKLSSEITNFPKKIAIRFYRIVRRIIHRLR